MPATNLQLTGPARRAPELLRTFATGKAKARRQALVDLTRIVVQNDQFTPASLEVAPLLAAAAAAPEPKEKGSLLTLLADIAVAGDHVFRLTSGYDVREPSFAGLPDDHPLKRVYAGVARGVDGYIALLAAEDAETRAAAPLVLAFLSSEAERSLHPVRARVEDAQEADERARASAVLCLGYLARYLELEEERDRLARIHDTSEGLVRVAAALALMQVGPAVLGEGPRQTLLDALRMFQAPVAGFPWCRGQVAHFASLALACVAVEARAPALLLGVLDDVAEMPTYATVADALVDAAFDDQASARAPRSPKALSPVQRRVLEAILDRRFVSKVFFTLARRGLPPRPAALERILGRTPPGPLDREVSGEPLWLLGLRALRGDAAAADGWVAGVTEGRSAEEAIGAAADALEGPYALAGLLPAIEEDNEDNERRRWLAAELLASRALAKALDSGQLSALGESLRATPDKPLAAAALFAAAAQGATLDPSWDPLIAGAAAEDASPELRRVVAVLPQDRREALIKAVPFTHEAEEGPDDEPVIHAGGAWALADLCPTQAVAELVIAALVADDEDPPPLERAKEVLAAMGPVGEETLAAAVKRPGQPRRELLKELLRALGNA